MNLKKCEGPARSMDIIGLNFNSVKKSCFLAKSKASKYRARLLNLRKSGWASSKELQRVVGYLVYAAWALPFGRPFISHISYFIDVKNIYKKVRLDVAALTACDIWLFLLKKNPGLPFNFILGKLPRKKDEWFVDASKKGYGGLCGTSFFKISHKRLLKMVDLDFKKVFGHAFIAYRELLAVLLACQMFAKISPKSFVRINSDNSNVVTWVNKGRCSKKLGFLLLSAIEFFKFRFGLRVKAYYIKSRKNVSADKLSRGRTPIWLRRRGVRVKIDVPEIVQLLNNPLPFWRRANTLL